MYKVGTVARLKGVVLGVCLWMGLIILTPFISLGAGSVTLDWDGSPDPGVAGYYLYYGTASHNYPNQIQVGANLSAVVSSLADGNTYYFAVTAVDAQGLESDFSNEISYSTPGINHSPTISAIADQSGIVNQTTASIAFTIADGETAASSLVVSATSSNPTVVPNAGIVLGGSGASRNVKITPAADQTGSAQITISVNDGTNSASSSFILTVQTNPPPTISAIVGQTVTMNQATAAIPFTINDLQTPAASLVLSAASSNPTLVPVANVVFGGSGANRTVKVTPASGQIGSAQITVSVSDGTGSASSSFNVTVQANPPPTISAIAGQTVTVNQATAAIPFTINDSQTPAANLVLSADSSNPLVPVANVVFGGSGANRTVKVTPASGQTGTAQITVSVSDGTGSASSSFNVTVQPAPPISISAIPDQNAYVDHPTLAIPFTITDPSGLISSVTVSGHASSQAVVSDANIVFGGSGANRTVMITPEPGRSGAVQITISATDGTATAQTNFLVVFQQLTAMPKTDLAKSSTYGGLFYEDAVVRSQSAGSFSLKVTSAGKYSGSLQMAAGKYAFSGQFGTLCLGTNVIVRKGSTPLVLSFILNSGTSTNQFTGSLSDGVWAAPMHGALAAFNVKTNPAPYAGNYTMAIPGDDGGSSVSLGHGFGSLKVDGNGNVKFVGTLADGTKISQSAPLSKDGLWPLFVPLYKGTGLTIAWISFTNRTGDDLHGALSWIKQPDPKAHYYPEGLALEGDAIGSTYAPASALALNVEVSKLHLSGVDAGKITALKISAGTGTFNGSMANPVAGGKPVPFQGALLIKSDTGYGFVLGSDDSTPMMLTQ